jgi:solute carrier family 25 iron transporter 28/37
MDVVKQRLQLGCYQNSRDCVRQVLKTEGVWGFYRSLPTTLMINAPYGGVFVALNERLRRNGRDSVGSDFAAAGLAAAGAAVSTHPLDVVKTRLQTQDLLCAKCPKAAQVSAKYEGFSHTVRTIFLEEGVNGFYRGLIPRTMLSIPSAATCWGVYEGVKRVLVGNTNS